MSKPALNWDVLTIKRPGLSRDIPAGHESLMWVANSAALDTLQALNPAIDGGTVPPPNHGLE